MILETAELRIKEGSEAEFLAAVAKAVPLFQNSKGCRAMRLQKVIETPGLFRLHVEWETLEDHTVTFRESEAFTGWRALVSPYFTEGPRVDHSELALTGF